MSTKKQNILYNPYMQTKIILNSLVIDHAISVEQATKEAKLEEIQQMYLAAQEALAKKAEEDLKRTQEIFDSSENQEPFPEISNGVIIDNELVVDETTQDINPAITTEEPITQEINAEEEEVEPIDFDLLRQVANEEYEVSVSKIRSLFAFEVFTLYESQFQNFDFKSQYFNVLGEMFEVTDLLSSKFFLKFGFDKKNYLPSIRSFNIKYILYMEDFLFFWNLQAIKRKEFRKFRKIKLKKWKFKKRKLRKLYSLKKIRKFILFKKFKKTHYNVFFSITNFFIKTHAFQKNVLVQKIPISDRVVSQYNVEFFYKLNKHFRRDFFDLSRNFYKVEDSYLDNFFIYARNFHQKPYWKLRKARRIHWSLFYKKTIRKQRYGSFINKFIKKYTKFSYNYMFLINFLTRFRISWTRTASLSSFCKYILVEKTSSIIKLPFFFSRFFSWQFLKKKSYYLKKKIGRWSFLNFKRSRFPWLQRKKNIPKIANHVQPNCHFLRHLSYLDPMTGYAYLNSDLDLFTFPVVDSFKANYHIKLHMYRYKSNN